MIEELAGVSALLAGERPIAELARVEQGPEECSRCGERRPEDRAQPSPCPFANQDGRRLWPDERLLSTLGLLLPSPKPVPS